MLSRRSKITSLFLFLILFTLSACGSSSTPAPTQDPASKDADPLKAIRACMETGNQIYVDIEGHYCFSLPLGYYQVSNVGNNGENSSGAVSLRLHKDLDTAIMNSPESTPSVEDIIASSVTMNIAYEKIKDELKDEKNLLNIVNGQVPEGKENRIPWIVGTENAVIEKNQKNANEPILYIVFMKHGNRLYKISFNPLPERNSNLTELETLFFCVTRTFKFID